LSFIALQRPRTPRKFLALLADPCRVGVVHRSVGDAAVAVTGTTRRRSGVIPLGVSGTVNALDVEQIVDGRRVDVVKVFVGNAKEITRKDGSIVRQGRMGDTVAVRQQLTTGGEELPVGIIHGPATGLVLENDVQDFLELLASASLSEEVSLGRGAGLRSPSLR
jgi:hypothetical protein